VKDRKYQFDVAKVTIARCEALMTCFTLVSLSRNTHTRVKWPMMIDGATFVKVEEASIRYFDLGLIDNVLTRPAY
jgi:hypothetical protein